MREMFERIWPFVPPCGTYSQIFILCEMPACLWRAFYREFSSGVCWTVAANTKNRDQAWQKQACQQKPKKSRNWKGSDKKAEVVCLVYIPTYLHWILESITCHTVNELATKVATGCYCLPPISVSIIKQPFLPASELRGQSKRKKG